MIVGQEYNPYFESNGGSEIPYTYPVKEDDVEEKQITVDGYLSPQGGPDITDHELQILGKTYASCRKNGGDPQRCSKIAWGAVNKFRKGKS